MSKRIKLKMNPEIISKASPNFHKIESKAVAGVTPEDIIERNVIAEYRTEEADETELEQSDEETDV